MSLRLVFHPLSTAPQEAFVEECELIKADILENDLEVLGEFVTEETMKDVWEWSEILVCPSASAPHSGPGSKLSRLTASNPQRL